jgi:hypothetical protein
MSAVTFDAFAPFFWTEGDLQDKFRGLLVSYVPMLRFLGSRNFIHSEFDEGEILAQQVANNMVLTLVGAEDLEISFDYLNWQPYFVTNSDNGIIRPEELFTSALFFTYSHQRYLTYYDISYPVLATVSDVTAFNGQGYKLIFAMESNIRNNLPAKAGKMVEPRKRVITPIACNEEHRSTEFLKTIVIDSYTKEPVEMVRVGFTIPEVDECAIGITDDKGVVEQKYPAVYGGVTNFINPEYLTSFYPIDTYRHQDQPAIIGYAVAGQPEKVIEIHKFKEINISVKKKEFKKCLVPLECEYTYGILEFDESIISAALPFADITCRRGKRQCFFQTASLLLGDPDVVVVANQSLSKYNEYYFINKPKDLKDYEQATFTLTRVGGFNDEVWEDDYQTAFSVKGTEKVSVRLVPGRYKVSGSVIQNLKLTVPPDLRCFGYDVITWASQDCTSIEAMELSEYLLGKVDWNTEDTYIEITPDQLYGSDEITFYMTAQDLKSVPEKVKTLEYECGGFLCYEGDCLFEACGEKTVSISGRVIEEAAGGKKFNDAIRERGIINQLMPTFSQNE